MSAAAASAPADDILDRAAYQHQARILRALHAARPVEHAGRRQFIHTVTAQQAGGRIEMTVYLMGEQAPVDSAQIELPAIRITRWKGISDA